MQFEVGTYADCFLDIIHLVKNAHLESIVNVKCAMPTGSMQRYLQGDACPLQTVVTLESSNLDVRM